MSGRSVNESSSFHVLTVGWEFSQLADFWDRIGVKGGARFSHILHPRYTRAERPDVPPRGDVFYLRRELHQPMPPADPELLASLEQEGVPTVHNMILGDPIVSKISYPAALGFATFLARRLVELYSQIRPSAIIGSFDCLHSSISYAVARRMNIPWYAMNFSVIPQGFACFCDGLSANSRVLFGTQPPSGSEALAEEWLRRFEVRKVQAYAYIAPQPLPWVGKIINLPRRVIALARTLRNSRLREHLQYTEGRNLYSVPAVLGFLRRSARARKAVAKFRTIKRPPATRFALFGLHLQPESSIDVWAPFFSNQMWVIELLARSLPPTHKLLVKVHKSDISNYLREDLERMVSFPGVELVAPFADTRAFIQAADVIVTIQGTMGLEGALLGKQVIVLGDTPVVAFPNVTRIGAITDLPALVRSKLALPPPSRREIVSAYAAYLAPFMPASHNDWTLQVTDLEIDGYVALFHELRVNLTGSNPQWRQLGT
jgi:hypothetical protein